MKYSEYAIESMQRNLFAKAMKNTTPKGLAAMLFEAAEIIVQLRAEKRKAESKLPPCELGARLWWVTDEDEEGNPRKSVGQWEMGCKGVLLRADGWYVEDCCQNIDKIGSRWACLTREDAERVLAAMQNGEEGDHYAE